MKTYFILLMLVLTATLHAQQKKVGYKSKGNAKYILYGTINMDTGHIRLVPITDGYYPAAADFKEVAIEHGHFTFTGIAQYVLGVQLSSASVEDGYISGVFYIEPGSQSVVCNKDSLREIPRITNKAMAELKGSFHIAFNNYRQRYIAASRENDSLREVYKAGLPKDIAKRIADKKQSARQEYYKTYVAYVNLHPNSYVALWHVVEFMESGYSPYYDTVYAHFSKTVKQTPTGRYLKKQLDASKATEIGRMFPQLALLDTAHAPVVFPLPPGAHKYILVDFWFAHCGACLNQFTKLTKIYDTSKDKGLEIIGISIDKPADQAAWKSVIKDKDLRWPQYLDEGGKQAVGMNINTYPRNFLLDEHNVIIRKDIKPADLAQLLAESSISK